MNKIIIIALMLCVSNLYAQERISDFAGGVVSQDAIYIGEYNNHMYYYDKRQERTNVFSERLTDGQLNSDLILSFDKGGSLNFNKILLTDNKLVFEDDRSLYIYDVESEETLEFVQPEGMFFSNPVYSQGKAFMLHYDSIYQVDLNTGAAISYVRDVKSDNEFYFNDESNIVLVDSFAILVDIDHNTDEQLFLSVNLFTGESELLYTFDTFDFYGNPIYDNGAFHLQAVNTLEETHRLYSFKSRKGGIDFGFKDLETPDSLRIESVHDDYCYAVDFDLVAGQTVNKYYLQDFLTEEYRVFEFVSSFDSRSLEVTNEGIYFIEDKEFGFANFEGDTTILMSDIGSIRVVDSEYRRIPGNITEEHLLASVFLSDFSARSIMFNKDGVIDLGLVSARRIIYDEKQEKRLIYAAQNSNDIQIGRINNQEIEILQHDEIFVNVGGEFTTLDQKNKIIQGVGNFGKGAFYSLNEDYEEAPFDEIGDFSGLFTMNNELNFFRKNTDDIYLCTINIGTHEIDSTLVNLNGVDNLTILNIYEGTEYSIIAYLNGGTFRLASISPDGNFLPIEDPDNPGSVLHSFFGNYQSVNGVVYGQIDNNFDGTSDFVRFGKSYEKTIVVIEQIDPFGTPLFNYVEGDNWSFIDVGSAFMIKNDGLIIEVEASRPIYNEGKFYFTDRIFDEELEAFSDWGSNLSNVEFVYNGIAYNSLTTSIEAVNVETLEKTVLDFDESPNSIRYFESKGNTAMVNHRTDKILVTDGTESGTSIIDLENPIKSFSPIVFFGSVMVMSTYNDEIGNELFALDVQTGETREFDIYSGEYSSNPTSFIQNSSELYFTAFDANYGIQLYRLSKDMILSVVNEDEESVELIVYPNPTTDFISIDEDIAFDRIAIFSIDGSLERIVSKDQSISVSDLSQGTYIIKVLRQGRIIGTGKFVKI